jgi:hypothetical protein
VFSAAYTSEEDVAKIIVVTMKICFFMMVSPCVFILPLLKEQR